ncbi:countin-1-like [Liolophura sinensis]|uniref:countin-1-like n=1 Tax=Liolophura sinensis TaxID=3198878 RepID=UPI003158C8D7
MKLFVVTSVGFLLAVEALALKPVYFQQPRAERRTAHIRQVTTIPSRAARVGLDLCPTCIDFTGQAINTLLNIILNAGVVGTCGELCQLLEQKTGSQALGAVCDILCDVVGIEEFIKLIEKADLDPIYFCELLKVCPIFDNGDAKITMLSVTPSRGPQGTTFVVDLEFVSKNGTGTGQIDLEILAVDGLPLGDAFLNKQSPPGTYGLKFNIKAEPDPNCDPTQQECEQWLPGNYVVKVAVCNGECGSAHPHSKIYDQNSTNFTLTG